MFRSDLRSKIKLNSRPMPPEPNKPGDLHTLLHRWKIDATLSPGFQNRVWSKISQPEQSHRSRFWQGFIRYLDLTFARPWPAFSCVASLVALGAVLGFVRAENKTFDAKAELAARYVQSVDPYQMPR